MNNNFSNMFNPYEYNNYDDPQIYIPEINIENIINSDLETFSFIDFLNSLGVFNNTELFDPLDEVLIESFEQQPEIPKTDYIITISSQRYNSLSNEIKVENKQCSICMVAYENEEYISITKCNHIFHTECIKEWGKYKQECPICRVKIEDFIKIYKV